MKLLGLTLILIGLPCAYISRRQLGACWSIRPQAPFYIVKTGFYRYLNHPMYFFGGVWLLGLLTLVNGYYTSVTMQGITACIMCIYIGIQLERTFFEDKVLGR